MSELQTLGDYSLIKQIGHGALGKVFLAEQRFMKKQFAIKVLPEDLCSDRLFIQKFEEEIGLLSKLEHPNIVKIHNISYDQGRYFLVTDCIVDEVGETTNLSQYLQARGKRLSEKEVFRLLRQVADALDYAHHIKGHGNGIAHRGLKLNNILVSKGTDGVNYYLSDFGLSRIIGTGTFLTRTFHTVAETLGIKNSLSQGMVDEEKVQPVHISFLQSFHFLAPEQKRMDLATNIETKLDTYAFGVLAYYLLMKEFPEGYFDMPASKFANQQYNWDELLRACLQPNPKNRPDLLGDLLDSLKDNHSGQVSQPSADVLQCQKVVPAEKGDRTPLRPVLQTAQLERPQHDSDPAAVFRIDSSVKQYTPEEKEDALVEPILTDMVVIQGGAFQQGSTNGNRDETPLHQVILDSFAIDIHPVTNEQFVRFLETMGGVKDSNHHDLIRLKDSRITNSKGKFSIESGYIKHPVVGVTWYGAVGYAKWIGKRLPTEAEWEIAARGGLEHSLYPFGDELEKSQANFFSADSTVVMSYPPNEYGLYDMAGNVYEWCQDWYDYNYYETAVQEPLDPSGPLQGVYRVLRGGCWKSLKEDLRCAKRHRNNPGTVNSTYGFRCAADVQ